MSQKIAIERVDHIGIRVRDLDRALNFYRVLGFDLLRRAEGDDVAIVRNGNGVELNLIFNANAGEPGPNVLMDVPEKYPGYTHMALRVGSIPATIAALRANDIAVSKIEINYQFTVYPFGDLCNLSNDLLVLGVLGKHCLRFLIGGRIGVLHDNEPVSRVRACLKATQPIGNPVFEIDGFQGLGQGCYVVDATTPVVRDG